MGRQPASQQVDCRVTGQNLEAGRMGSRSCWGPGGFPDPESAKTLAVTEIKISTKEGMDR